MTVISIALHHIILLKWFCLILFKHKFSSTKHILCFYETYLDSSFLSDDANLSVPNCSSFGVDKSLNKKPGGVSLYHKSSLLNKETWCCLLTEWIFFDLKIRGKMCWFLSRYRSFSQNQLEFEVFLETFHSTVDYLALNIQFVITVVGDLSAKLKRWYSKDISVESSKINLLLQLLNFIKS